MHRYHSRINIRRQLKAMKTNFQELLIADSIRLMALSLFSIFVPIFLYQKGYSIMEIIGFQLVYPFLFMLIAVFLVANMEKIGIKRSLVASYIFTVLFYITLFNTDFFLSPGNKYYFLAFLAIIFSFSESVFYCSHHLYFIKSTASKNTAKKYGLLYSLPIFFSLFSPFVGAVLIDNLGFKAVFILCAVLMFVAGMIIFATRDYKIKIDDLNWKKILDLQNGRKNYIYFVQGMVFRGTGFIWPFYMFLANLQVVAIGLFYLVSNLSAALGSYYAGRYIDRTKSNARLARFGIIGHSLSVIARGFLKTPIPISFLHLIAGLFGSAYSVSLDSGFYKYAHNNSANNAMNMELYCNLGKFFSLWGLAILLLLFDYSTAFIAALVIIGLFELSLIWVINKSNKIIY